MRPFLILIIAVFLCNCTSNKTKRTENLTGNTILKVITPNAIENFDYQDYALSTEAESLLKSWPKYQELAIQINYLKKADLSFFNGDIKPLKDFIISFKKETPKQIYTNPIVSRTVIIETKLLKLHDNLTLDTIDLKLKLLSIKELLIAFSNLNYQINKKLEEDFYNKISPE